MVLASFVVVAVAAAAEARVSAASRSRWLVSWSFLFQPPPPSGGDFTGPLKLLTDEKKPRILRKLPTTAPNLLHPISLEPSPVAPEFYNLYILLLFFDCSLSKRNQHVIY